MDTNNRKGDQKADSKLKDLAIEASDPQIAILREDLHVIQPVQDLHHRTIVHIGDLRQVRPSSSFERR